MNRMGLIALAVIGCHCNLQAQNKPATSSDSLSYLAMGDSYTVGRMMPAAQSFPYLLVNKLNSKSIKTAQPVVTAQNGWRTDELLNFLKNAKTKHTYDVVTLLIGVNNHYQKKDIEIYRAEFKQILDSAIVFAKGNPKHVVVLSIPDWGVTPFAAFRNAPKITVEIDAYNEINKEITKKAGAVYINVTGLTRDVAAEPDIYAPDQLHYSGKMYGWWADKVASAIRSNLK
jgi:lysophospholipase L1-like esterase